METIIQKEIHDAKIKLVHAINHQDKDLIKKYEQIIKELEQQLRLLDK